MQRVKEELQCCQPLLPVDYGPFLHRPSRVLHLLEHDCAKEMRVLPSGRVLKQALRHTDDVTPQRLPLVVLVPHIWPLEQRHDEPLRLHEHHLRCANLSLHPTVAPHQPIVRMGIDVPTFDHARYVTNPGWF